MDTDFQNKIRSDLEKSGFASEMRAIQTLRHMGWTCSGAGSYFDLDNRITRTIDATANRLKPQWEHGDNRPYFEYHLFIEVKKSDRPWIVFRQNDRKIGDAWNNPYVSHNLPVSLSTLSPLLKKHSIRDQLGWLAYGVHEAFKEVNDTGRWYSAAVSSCKATYDYVRREAFQQTTLSSMFESRGFLAITHPIVVLAGDLFSAELIADTTINLQSIQFAPFEFQFGTAHYETETYRVDLVRLDALESYLKVLNARFDAIYAALSETTPNS